MHMTGAPRRTHTLTHTHGNGGCRGGFFPEQAKPEKSGGIGPFEAKAVWDVVSQGHDIIMTGNIFWIDTFFSLSPSVPISKKKVDMLVDLYQHAEGTPPIIDIALPATAHNSGDVDTIRGANQFKTITPAEQCHAMVIAAWRASKAEDDKDSTVLQKWRALLQSTPMRFRVMDPQTLYWASLNHREAIDTTAVAVRRID